MFDGHDDVPPYRDSLPFKLILFVLSTDEVVAGSLVASYGVVSQGTREGCVNLTNCDSFI